MLRLCRCKEDLEVQAHSLCTADSSYERRALLYSRSIALEAEPESHSCVTSLKLSVLEQTGPGILLQHVNLSCPGNNAGRVGTGKCTATPNINGCCTLTAGPYTSNLGSMPWTVHASGHLS